MVGICADSIVVDGSNTTTFWDSIYSSSSICLEKCFNWLLLIDPETPTDLLSKNNQQASSALSRKDVENAKRGVLRSVFPSLPFYLTIAGQGN